MPTIKGDPLHLERIWLLIPTLLVGWAALMHPLRRLDFWWHLKMVEILVEQRYLPTTDLFSFTAQGKPFTYPNWLAEVIFYLLWRIGGLEWLIFFDALLLTSAFLFVMAVALDSPLDRRLVALLMLLPAITFALYSNLRTQTFSFLLLAYYLWVLWGIRRGRRRALVWTLPLLMALWVNLHGAYILGLGLLGGFLVSESIRRWWHGETVETIPPDQLRRLALVLLLTVGATLLTPYGVGIYGYVRQLQQDPASQRFVTEWQPPRITNREHLLLFYAPFFIVLLGLLYSATPLDLTELGLFLGFTIFALSATRNGIWFAIVVSPIFVRHMAALRIRPLATLRRRYGLDDMPSRRKSRPRRENRRLNVLILLMLLGLTVLFTPWVRPRLGGEHLRATLVEESTPVGAMDFIEAAGITGRIFHHQAYGDYMIWRLWPQQRTFIDGRVHLFDRKIVEAYVTALNALEWETTMEQYGIEYILLPKELDGETFPLLEAVRQSPDWQVLYEDEKSVLFERLRR